jgi:hypothetical protein
VRRSANRKRKAYGIITAVLLILDLMQFRLDNMGGHISHLSGALFGFLYIKLLENGTDLSAGVTKVIDLFANIFRKSPSTPFKKVHKIIVNHLNKRRLKLLLKANPKHK